MFLSFNTQHWASPPHHGHDRHGFPKDLYILMEVTSNWDGVYRSHIFFFIC